MKALDNEGDNGDHRGCYESYHYNTDTVSIAKTSSIVIYRRHNHCPNHQKPIGHGDINLTVKRLARMDHLNVWEIAHPHDLREEVGRCLWSSPERPQQSRG